MIWNPWRELIFLRQRLKSAEWRVKDLTVLNAASIGRELIIQRELAFAHRALRRKNKVLKALKARVK